MIIFKRDIDKKFFILLFNLYKPFLTKVHLNDEIQYTVFTKQFKYPIGIVSVKKGLYSGNFLQLAIIPSMKGKNLGQQILNKIKKDIKGDRIGWTANDKNYPSLKLLYNNGGGLWDIVIEKKYTKREISYKGYIKLRHPKIFIGLIQNLNDILPQSKKKYNIWIKQEYNKRQNELNKLNRYLENY